MLLFKGQKMKKILASTFLFLICTHALGAENFEVLERSQSNYGTYSLETNLEDLTSEDSFDGKYFKIVFQKSNEAIKFNNEKLRFKAATVYYHLTKARNFWIKNLQSEYVKSLNKITVRLDITNQFDELGHFANDKKSPQFNNAVSIPPGRTPEWLPADKQDEWDFEIWFRPSKNIHYTEIPRDEPNPLTAILQTLETPYIYFERGVLIQNILQHIFFPAFAPTPIWTSVIRFAGTYTLSKAIVKTSKKLDPLFMDRWYYLDTAMVPEVIHHEFAHIALSDSLELTHSTAVIEGFADYFAAIMTNKSQMYHEVQGYSNSAPKDTESKQKYNHWLEANYFATSDFVLSLLWDIRDELGSESSDKMILNSRLSLSTESSTINNHLLKALLQSCKKNCDDPRSDRLLLYQIFSKRGF